MVSTAHGNLYVRAHAYMMGADLRFIHCADLHLDAPFKNVLSYGEQYVSAMIESSYLALDAVIDKAISEKVDFIIFSGDIFDSEYSTPRSRFRFAEALKRSGLRCYIAYGNHDFERKWESSIPFSENVVEFPDHVVNVPYPNKENKIADIIGISHSRKEEDKDLTSEIDGTSDFSIAVVHCDVDSATEGWRYAPCKLQNMLTKKIDYWALGHVHKRNIVHKFPHVVYPGNTQGRSPKETGEKGAYLVTVTNGLVTDMEFFVTGGIRWIDIEADITGKEMNSLLYDIVQLSEENSFLNIRIVGKGGLDKMIRSEKDDVIGMIEKQTKSRVSKFDVFSIPDIDTEERKKIPDFTSSVIISSEVFCNMTREQIIEKICDTRASLSMKRMFEDMTDEELLDMVRCASSSLLVRLEAGK